MMKIRIATRTSRLALAQTKQVQEALEKAIPGAEITLVEVITTGDTVQDRSLATIGGKGLFIKGLEEVMIRDEADIAMHSLKDVPPTLAPEFCIAAVLPRQSPHDVLVSYTYNSLSELPKGATVGTSSVRREAALLSIRPDLKVKMMRGNVDSRLKKLSETHKDEYDALILAEAGLRRLGLETHIKEVLPLDVFVPSVGQGVIAIECKSTRTDLINALKKLNDHDTYARILAERAMNAALKAGCTSPVGSFATIVNGALQLKGTVWSADGQIKIEAQESGQLEAAEEIGRKAANNLLSQGADKLLTQD